MRGTLHGPSQFGDISRFIPAGAGNTTHDYYNVNSDPVYPRWRGEHHVCRTRGGRRAGLSPLARGTQFLFHVINSHSRFIPAGAGNTWKSTVKKSEFPVYPRWRGEHYSEHHPRRFVTVYPRWRGEHSAIWRRIRRPCGLSPLARGTPAQVRRVRRQRRFIPAGAGNTLLFSCLTTDRRGLSPLARGTPTLSRSQ